MFVRIPVVRYLNYHTCIYAVYIFWCFVGVSHYHVTRPLATMNNRDINCVVLQWHACVTVCIVSLYYTYIDVFKEDNIVRISIFSYFKNKSFLLTHGGRGKMDAMLQMTFSNAFSCLKKSVC